MSNTPQQPADGWQSPQQQPPVYRPNEEPPNEEPPPWSPESQRVSPPQQPVEDVDGTVRYVGAPGSQPEQPFGPPPGVPVSPFDAPPQPQQPFEAPQAQQPQQPFQASPPPQQPFQASPPPQQPFEATPQPQQMPPADPFAGGGGMPVSGMPVSGMPPVSSVPASGMPVSSPGGPGQYQQPPFGGGQFGPQGGQLVPVSGGASGSQPWGAPDPIKRKKKGGKGPMWLLIAGVVVLAAALGIGGFILFNPGGEPGDDVETATIETAPEGPAEEPAEPVLIAGPGTLRFVATGAAAGWAEAAEPPAVFTEAVGIGAEDGSGAAYVGVLDAAELGGPEADLGDADTAFLALLAEQVGAPAGEVASETYWVDGREARFHTYTAGDVTVTAAIVQVAGGFEGFIATASGDTAELMQTTLKTLRFGDL